VIDVVKKEIEEAEKSNTSWILEGFPRTRVQALALHKMGIVPDKFVHLGITETQALSRLRATCSADESNSLGGKELEETAMSLYRQWDVNQREVNNTFNKFIYFYDCDGKQQQDIANDLARMLRVRFRNGAPRRPPKVILIGPPGSGRSTQAELMAHRFGLVCISPEMLVREE
jgi:adenylate kinase